MHMNNLTYYIPQIIMHADLVFASTDGSQTNVQTLGSAPNVEHE